MAMRETVSSMRAYLILSGLLATVSYLGQIVASQGAIATALALAGLALSLGYLYIGIKFKRLIVLAPSKVLGILKLGGGFLLLILILSLLGGAGVAGVPAVGAGLLITWYLFVNARRLASEAQPSQTDSATSASA